MAGRGSRLRPHTLTTPKPLIPLGGISIVQRLAQDIVKTCNKKVDEIAFVIGDFGHEVEKKLKNIAKELGAKGSIYYQQNPLGTAHAILCAKDSLKGNCVVAFADTLFKASFSLDNTKEGIIWVKEIENPSSFGVVKLNQENIITDFVEKPQKFISNLAIIGVYYFKSGEYLKEELQDLLDSNIKDKGEYQLTNALENMKNKGAKFSIGEVCEWLDCGNKEATVFTNQRILEDSGNTISPKAIIEKATIIEPCFIADNAEIINSNIGPHVSIGINTIVKNSNIKNSIIQNNSIISNAELENSMLGNQVNYNGKQQKQEVSLGDFSEVK